MNLPINLAEPDAPQPQCDRVPCHLFAPEVAWPEPLPPVLRNDNPGRAPFYVYPREKCPECPGHCSDAWDCGHRVGSLESRRPDFTIRPLLGHYGVPDSVQAAMLRRPSWRVRLRRIWIDWHEWITATAILLWAAAAFMYRS